MEFDAILWLAVLIIAGLAEAATAGLFSIWFMAGAVAAFVGSLFHIPMPVQVLIFLVVSLVCMYFLRPLAKKYFQSTVVKTNADRVVGEKGIVVEDIVSSKGQTGQIKVMGQIWTALSDDGEDISAGTDVVVRRISGVKLMVSPVAPGENV